MMRFPKTTNALFAAALFLPTVGLFSALQASNSARTDAKHEAVRARDEAVIARRATEQSSLLNEQLQERLRCRSQVAQSYDVAAGRYLLAVTAGGPVDLTEERAALEAALDERARTADKCGG